MVLEEFYIFRHFVYFLFDFLELGLKTFEVGFELLYFLSTLFLLNFERDFTFIKHIIYQLSTSPQINRVII